MYKTADSRHYRPIEWEQAFALIANRLNALDSPDEAVFYTSGRTSNEAAFLYQLFARQFGTNNLPDCSNMCHESSGAALSRTIGIGKGTVSIDDFQHAKLVLVAGQNPGTNHPRMLRALEQAKAAGATIVSINPLPEAGLIRFKDPQTLSGVVGRGTAISDRHLSIRLGGDLALFQAVGKRLIEAERRQPGSAVDAAFVAANTVGYEDYSRHIAAVDDADVDAATGLARSDIDWLAEQVRISPATIVCWAMGMTQHLDAVAAISEVVNVLLLRGSFGLPGAGACPVRGHSNVQGDRTMGIWEQMPPAFLERLGTEFGFEPPARHGHDVVSALQAMVEGTVKVFVGLGGNLARSAPDSNVVGTAMESLRLRVGVATKLNRTHVALNGEALILPCLGRTEIDLRASGPQAVTVEDSMGMVHASRGNLEPASEALKSECAIVAGLAEATLGARSTVDWRALAGDYSLIRDHVGEVVPGFTDFNERIKHPGGFALPHPVRDERRFPTTEGKAIFTVNELRVLAVPPGRLLMQTIRSHDQFNTTIYGLDDRYRGIRKGRRVVFVSPADLRELGLADGQLVDIVSEWTDGERRSRGYRVVGYPTAKGCCATYFPEANELVPLGHTARESNTPASKSVTVRLEPTA